MNVQTCLKSEKKNCTHLSIKLNETKEKTASNKGNSQDGYFPEYQRGI